MNRVYILMVLLACASCVPYVPVKTGKIVKPSPFEQIDFEGILRRYLGKDYRPGAPIEGIYEVSCTITRKGKSLFSKVESERVVGRYENFAKIAIVKDWPGSKREYLEISLKGKGSAHYPIIGEFQSFSEGGGYIYKHYVPPNKNPLSFTFTLDLEPEILEGTRAEVKGSKTFIYKLTYLKVYPKKSDFQTVEPEGR